MDIEFQEFLNKDIGYGNTLKNKKMKLLNEIKESVIKDKEFFEQAIQLDFEKWKKKMDLAIFSKMIDEYIEMEKNNHTVKIEEGNTQIEKIVSKLLWKSICNINFMYPSDYLSKAIIIRNRRIYAIY